MGLIEMAKYWPTKNISGGKTIEECCDTLEQAKSVRDANNIPFACRFAEFFGLGFFHQWKAGQTYETTMSGRGRRTKVLWNIKICQRCFCYREQRLGVVDFLAED